MAIKVYEGELSDDMGPNMQRMDGDHVYMPDGSHSTEVPEVDLIEARYETHGDFSLNAHYGQLLRAIFHNAPGWETASTETREALEYIAGKLARIISGRPNERQHWEDIMGYAQLVLEYSPTVSQR